MKRKKTALVFSGGGAKGSFQIGVWKALREMGIKIDMVFGTSIGAVNGAMVVMNRFDEAETLWKEIVTEEVFDIETNGSLENLSILGLPADQLLGYAKEVAKGGAEKDAMAEVFHKYIDEKAFFKSKMDYGLCITEFPSLKGRQVYKEEIPKGQLADYVMASASCFPVAKPTEIDGVSYIDGGYFNNLPIDMAVESGAEVIIAVDLGAIGVVDKKELEKARDNCQFYYLQPKSDLGNFLYFDPASAETNIRLGYLATLRKFGKLDGHEYSFKKGEFSKKELIGAEYAASHFGLDPREIYTKEILNQDLSMRILDAQVAVHKQAGHIPPNLSDIDAGDLRAFVSNLREKYQVTSLIVLMAEHIRDNDRKLVLKSTLAKKLLKDELAAAYYIVAEGLLYS